MTDHHRFLVRQSLRHMRYIEEMIEELDKEITLRLKPYQQQLALAVYRARNQADWRREYLSRDRDGHDSRGPVSRLSSSGVMGGDLPGQ